MKLILIGPQGCGKGTQAKMLKENYNLAHISTGDIFRENIKNSTELGKLAKSYIDKGELVPDEVTINMVKERLSKDDCKEGYILDGFPRNVSQAEKLSEIVEIDNVVLIQVDDEESVSRISNRRTCPTCGRIYNLITLPPKNEGVCDDDGTKLVQRDDDMPEAIKKRLEIYHSQTKPIVEYYQKQGKVLEINGMQDINLVFEEIKKKLN